ncbi:MAG TPA: beta-eliminating lyase-related protein, partial [Chitinophagaceae bacterium]|nr:beta-eliminating lyase-related protein [Chitinophagaceae bacterium]
MIDFRSDTVTKPTPAMLEAMMQAIVGDDVFGEDITVNELENKAANLFGMEAALFCPSGTMTNQIAIKVHTQPGDEVICDELSHIYQYEGGGIAFNSGCSIHLIKGNGGRITAEQVQQAINNPNDIHKANSKLVSLENTM